MFKTILESSKLLNAHDKYILTSCDCFGEFDIKKLKNISKKKIDLCLFGFKFSNLQTKLNNAHTQIVTEKHAVKDIKVKSKYNSMLLGHAGFFWINSKKVFGYFENFLKSKYFKFIKREVIIDDYFKFLVKNKLIKTNFIELKATYTLAL